MDELSSTDLCPGCGAQVTPGGAYCSDCGKPLTAVGATPSGSKAKWYYNVWFILLMLFFVLGPLGLPLVWKNPRFSRGVKLLLSLVMVVYTVLLIDWTIKAVRAAMDHLNQFNATLQF